MTDTSPSSLARAEQWLADEGHTLADDARRVFHALVNHARALEAVAVKDGPAVEQVVDDAAPIVADVTKAATGSA